MAEQEFCQHCEQRHDCGEIYGKLGNVEGPSVALKVVVAFLLPMLVFILSLAVFGEIFGRIAGMKGLETVFGLGAALLVTFVCIFVTSVVRRRFSRNK